MPRFRLVATGRDADHDQKHHDANTIIKQGLASDLGFQGFCHTDAFQHTQYCNGIRR